MFFLILLPPIIFESGYNLHKGNFFQVNALILSFLVLCDSTIITFFVEHWEYPGICNSWNCHIRSCGWRRHLSTRPCWRCLPAHIGSELCLWLTHQCCWSCSNSRYIPGFYLWCVFVFTIVLSQALDVDPILNMLVFGESILNDAVSIVLTTTIVESGDSEVQDSSMAYQVGAGIGRWEYLHFWNLVVECRVYTVDPPKGSSWCSLALLELEPWWRCWVRLSWSTLTCTPIQGTNATIVLQHFQWYHF